MAFEIETSADYNGGVIVTIINFGAGSGSDNFNLALDRGFGTAQSLTDLTSWTLNTPRTFAWSAFTPSGVNGRTGGETINVTLINTNNDEEATTFPTLTRFTITATANNSGVFVTITDMGTGSYTTPFNLYIDINTGSEQSITETTEWIGGETRPFFWNEFTPNTARVGSIKISLLNNDLELLSNEVTTIVSGATAKISATADYTTGVTVTISNFGSGTDANTFNLVIDKTLATEQTKNGLTSWTLNTPRTIPWSAFTPSGLNGRTGGETITIDLTDTTTLLAGTASTTLSGSGGGGGVPCFVASSKLLTPTGYCAAADIKTGDLLMTADGRQISIRAYSFTVEVADKDSAPFFIPKNSISMGCPNADLRLSPWHAFQLKKGLWMKPMSAFELGMSVQQYDLGKPVTYYHFEAPNFFKDNFICEGTVVESFGGLQTKGMKGRVYTYNSTFKGYTRVASKPVSKAIRM